MSHKKFNISICSYNVFWKIMKNDHKLFNYRITKSELEILKLNLLKNIYLIKNYYNPDFFCFQESESYDDLLKLFENTIFEYHLNYSKPEYMLTIWKKKLFSKKIAFDGEFETGRPFTILVFKDVRFNKYFILINIHAGHNKNTSEHIFAPIQKLIDANIKQINKFDISRIIICGDFNRDIGLEIYQNQINEDLKKKYSLKIKFKTFNFLPYNSNNKTCCSLTGYGFKKNYDQSIDSFSNPIITHQLNKEKWYKSKSSDHLAILTILKNVK